MGRRVDHGAPNAKAADRGRCETTGKTNYTYAEARRKAKRHRRAHHEVVQAYRCRDCPWWHFGHAPAIYPHSGKRRSRR